MSRRGLFAFAGAGAVTLLVANVGQSIGGPLRTLAFLAPRREDFPVNKRARGRGRDRGHGRRRATSWCCATATRSSRSSREELLALPQRTARLPIACVEGWSTTQEWTGVRLSLLAERAGAPGASEVLVESLQPKGVLRRASLSGDQIAADDSMLALKVNGEDLSMDHGFPARIIVPALPGVHNTKWVGGDDVLRRDGPRYGASPVHLLAHLILLPLIALGAADRARLPRGVERRAVARGGRDPARPDPAAGVLGARPARRR